MKTKTVFDTNIWVSYFLKGNFKELVEMVFDYDVDFYRAKELTREISDVLTRNKLKKYLTLPISEYIRFYERLSILIKIKLEFSGCRDPKDNFLFDLAYQSNSKYLVSFISAIIPLLFRPYCDFAKTTHNLSNESKL